MSLRNRLTVWTMELGNLVWGSLQAASIGTSFGNGALSPGGDGQNNLAMGQIGDLYTEVHPASGAGVLNPAATGADVIMSLFTIPASAVAQAFDVAGRGINISAAFNIAASVNAKRTKIIINPTNPVVGQTVSGGTTIADSGTVNTVATGGGQQLGAQIYKYGANGSNTQVGVHQAAQSGNAVAALLAPQNLTLTENANITVAITGNATTAATDIALVLVNADGNN